MAKKSDMPADQTAVVITMRRIRAAAGLSREDFAKIIGVNTKNLEQRERCASAWPPSEIPAALAALTEHLQKSLQAVEALALKFSPPANTKSL